MSTIRAIHYSVYGLTFHVLFEVHLFVCIPKMGCVETGSGQPLSVHFQPFGIFAALCVIITVDKLEAGRACRQFVIRSHILIIELQQFRIQFL